MQVQPFLFFNGRCEEALRFYVDAVGARVTGMLRFSENPDRPPPGVLPAELDDKIMHAIMTIGDTEIMASDGLRISEPTFQGVTLALAVPSAADADRMFDALSEGGEVQLPIHETFFAERFGMAKDRFGVSWMVVTQARH